MKKSLLLLLALALTGCAMSPEERTAWTQFGLESARAYRDAKLAPKPVKAQK